MSNSQTKFGWISSNGLGGDSITDGRDYNIPLAFLKRRGDKNLSGSMQYIWSKVAWYMKMNTNMIYQQAIDRSFPGL